MGYPGLDPRPDLIDNNARVVIMLKCKETGIVYPVSFCFDGVSGQWVVMDVILKGSGSRMSSSGDRAGSDSSCSRPSST